jgi:hypothetical protein
MKKNLIFAAILASLSLSVHAGETGTATVSPAIAAPVHANVDSTVFTEACLHLDQASLTLKKNGKTLSLVCQTPDGGNVVIAVVNSDDHGDEGTAGIHQTAQMNGSAIFDLINSLNTIPIQTISVTQNKECGEKLLAAPTTANYGDVQVVFNHQNFSATCDVPSNPFKTGLKALGSFLTKQAE